MRFTPVSQPGRPVCEALEQFELSRPVQGLEEQRLSHLIAFVLLCLLWTSGLAVLYVLRDAPRLRVVRPFFVSATLANAQVLFAIGIALNLAIPTLPCGFMLFCCLISVAGFGINYILRASIYSIETQFAVKVGTTMRQTSFKVADMTEEEETLELSQRALTPEKETIFSRFRSIGQVTKLALGLINASEVSVQHLAVVKRSFPLIASVLYIPAIICFVVVIATVPTFQSCAGCSIFLEVTIALAIVAGLNVLIGMRILYVCWRRDFPDAQGVFEESAWVLFLVVPIFLVSGIMLMADPNQTEFNRRFNFEWILEALMAVYWWFVAGKQIYEMVKAKWALERARKNVENTMISSSASFVGDFKQQSSSSGNKHNSWLSMLMEDEPQRTAFEQFTMRHYAVESLHFVLDVYAFKRYFDEKGISWRRQKAKYFLETYVRFNSVMEVNISYDVRTDIINRAEAVINESEIVNSSKPGTGRTLKELFDMAVDDIIVNILRSLWVSFKAEERKNHPSSSAASTPARVVKQLAASLVSHSTTTPKRSSLTNSNPRDSSGQMHEAV